MIAPRLKAALLLLFCLLPAGCSSEKEHLFSGRTMGTTYHIKLVAGRFIKLGAVQAKIDRRLEEINASMSIFRPDSEISRFNNWREPGPFAISADFLRVMLSAQEIYRLTDGAWDGSVYPLVNLWGFGRESDPTRTPTAATLAAAQEDVGFDGIEVGVTGYLKKLNPAVTVDLGSIAKGYGVDQVAVLLAGMGYRNFLVEIGGEVYAAGVRPDGTKWRVGINRPDPQAAAQEVYAVLELQGMAMATSGDYRNFYRLDGRTVSHIIDPRTGLQPANKVVSVSVVADNCTLADGLATGLMVMGPQKALALLDTLPGVEGLIIVRHDDGRLENFTSRGMGDFYRPVVPRRD